MDPKHVGSSFHDFLSEEGLLEEAEAVAAKRVLDFEASAETGPSRRPQASTDPLDDRRGENLDDES